MNNNNTSPTKSNARPRLTEEEIIEESDKRRWPWIGEMDDAYYKIPLTFATGRCDLALIVEGSRTTGWGKNWEHIRLVRKNKAGEIGSCVINNRVMQACETKIMKFYLRNDRVIVRFLGRETFHDEKEYKVTVDPQNIVSDHNNCSPSGSLGRGYKKAPPAPIEYRVCPRRPLLILIRAPRPN